VAWRETHNAPLQVAAELGTIGLVLFVLMIWSGFSAAATTTRMLRARAPATPRRRRLRLPNTEHERLTLYAAGFTASLAGWFVAAMFASVAYYWTLYLVVGLAIALRDIVKNDAPGAEVVTRRGAGVR
jgi:O-antigen ligase